MQQQIRNSARIPTPLWSAAYVERLEEEQATQRTGCVTCLSAGSEVSPNVIYMISGMSVCAQHAKEQLNVTN